MNNKERLERLELFIKEVLALDKHSWTTYIDKDPDEQWNRCNSEWKGDIKRLARIHEIK